MRHFVPRLAVSGLTVVLLIGASPATATPITYAIVFNTTSGNPAPTSGSFTYDDVSNLFSTFAVDWNGSIYDFTQLANSGSISNPLICDGSPGPESVFDVLEHTCMSPLSTYAFHVTTVAITDTNVFRFTYSDQVNISELISSQPTNGHVGFANGTWSLAPQPATTVPEPRPITLLMTALFGVLGLKVVQNRSCRVR